MLLALVPDLRRVPMEEKDLPPPDGNVLVLPGCSALGRFVGHTLEKVDTSVAEAIIVQLRAQVVADGSVSQTTTKTEEWLRTACVHAQERLEARLREAFELRACGDLDGAERHYRSVLDALGADGPFDGVDREGAARQALVLVTLAEILFAKGCRDESIRYLDRALAIAPMHIGALRARAEVARAGAERALSAAMLHRLVQCEQEPSRRFETLLAAADDSLFAARDALTEASAMRPTDIGLLTRLRAIHEVRNEWEEVVGVLVRIAEATSDPRARATVLAETARLCSERTNNVRRAVALYEAAIEDDPTVPGAFEAVEGELLQCGDYAGVAAAYERQLARLAPDATKRHERVRLLAKLAEVQANKLRDADAAEQSLHGLLAIEPENADAHLALSELLVFAKKHDEAIRALERTLHMLPTRPELYRHLYRLFTAKKDVDGAYGACAALMALGEADLDEQLTYAQYSPDGMLSPTGTMDQEAWHDLIPDGHSKALDLLMAVIEPAVIEVWRSEHPEAARQRPSERARRDPRESTASAIRCIAWASRFLGVPEPIIYAEPANHRVTIATLPCQEHAVVLGRHVLSGRSVPELAFITTHHAAYARPGCRVPLLYPEIRELEAFVRASIALARPDLPIAAELNERARALMTKLERALDRTRRRDLGAAVDRLMGDELAIDLRAWGLGVEQIACRAGLLACGDVAVATPALAISPGFGGTAKDRATALLPFSVSLPYARLRRDLGLAVTNQAVSRNGASSSNPPPSASEPV